MHLAATPLADSWYLADTHHAAEDECIINGEICDIIDTL